ncbi:MAG: branched-chain amino acid transport system II carrier protein [Parachlamydiaceae bacterium]|nr:branched-chain amino acid transport system II carrier protein [Parachlamydiaceae bacterium]
MKSKWLALSTGFALFSMFFGSGNLVFPITVGQGSEGHYMLAALGILLTGVVVPFLGVFGMMLYKGDLNSFFSSFGKKGTFIFSFLALALMGPFGVLARCLTVAHGALLLLFPNASLLVSSFAMCCVIYFLSVNKSKIVTLLGTVLTPFLLVAIAAISFFGLSQGSTIEVANANAAGSGWDALKMGFFQGYQTMDLLAAFFFSQFVISYLRNQLSAADENNSMLNIFCKSAMIGAGILSIVYFALVLLGSIYSPLLLDKPPQEMLGIIAMESLGSLAAPCLCIVIIFACLTTAIVLTSLFADFLCNSVVSNKIGNPTALLITLGIGFFVSTFDFAGIARYLGPILEAVYPALIVLTISNIICKLCSLKASHWPFTISILAKLSCL